MISDTIKYVNCLFEITKPKYEKVNDVILKSALVYQYLYLNNFDTLISIDRILELNNNEIGLIGPGNGCLTHFLEEYSIGLTYYTHIAFYMMLLVDSIAIIN